jgi:hypothetical protein
LEEIYFDVTTGVEQASWNALQIIQLVSQAKEEVLGAVLFCCSYFTWSSKKICPSLHLQSKPVCFLGVLYLASNCWQQ